MNQLTKACWSCPNETPYEEGWCSECQLLIPGDIAEALNVALSDPFAGAMRMAVSDIIRVKRARAAIRLVPKGPPRLSLDDLEIDL